MLACELLAVHQARCLGAALPPGTERLRAGREAFTAGLPASADDRPFGRDIEALRERLAIGTLSLTC